MSEQTLFPEGRMIDVGNATLEVFEAGSGIPVVLAHGWPEHAYSWRHQLPVLVAQGYHVIVPNQRGYGRSSRPPEVEAYDCHQLTGDFNGLLDAFGYERAIFVGHDWGAILVWHHALLHPRRVAGVAALSVPFRPREPSDPVAFWEQALGPDFYIVHFNRQPGVAARAFERNTRQFLSNMYRTRHWLQAPATPLPDPAIIAMAESPVAHGDPLMSEQELEVFVRAFEHSGFEAPCNWYRNFTRNWETTAGVAQTVQQPALFIRGRYDIVPDNDMSAHVPDLEQHELECGHWLQQEEPAQTNALLLDWLERRMRPLFTGP
jgi:pimeloyl-ACP methyl ester carboxylesterase